MEKMYEVLLIRFRWNTDKNRSDLYPNWILLAQFKYRIIILVNYL